MSASQGFKVGHIFLKNEVVTPPGVCGLLHILLADTAVLCAKGWSRWSEHCIPASKPDRA